MYYENLYGSNNSKLNQRLFDVNKQIASGLKIQYASDDVATFTETMRLDNEITTLGQIKQSTESGYKVSNQSDVILNDFEDSMNRFRTLLIQAANDTNSETSRDAISLELRGIENHLKNLSNTSINGQYLFSGSMVDVKPISDDGTYNGNDVGMNSFLGSSSQQQYNLTGADLFLGEEILVKREISTNIVQTLNVPVSPEAVLDEGSTMAEFMGTSPSDEHYFYLRGTKSDGTAFNKQIGPMSNIDTVGGLLSQIGTEYGNGSVDVVNVSLNGNGQIVIEDKIKGSSELDFHLVGATDFSGGGSANVAHIDLLDSAETDYATAIAGGDLYVKEFIKSGLNQADSVNTADNNLEALLYDRTDFSRTDAVLSSNVPQVLKTDNSFAHDATKLHEVFSGVIYNLDGTYNDGLEGKNITLEGETIAGGGATYSAEIHLSNAGSTYTLNGTTYDLFNMDNPRTQTLAGEVTYRQLMDIVNIAITGEIPTGITAAEYDTAVYNSSFKGSTSFNYDGTIEFKDLTTGATLSTLSMYDSNSGDFSSNIGSISTFNTNNALTVRDPKTDFFKTIDEMIVAVENYSNYPDASGAEIRNVGIQNAIAMMDDLQDHVFRSHSVVAAQSNTLTNSLERTQLLEISTMTLRSSVIDTDLAEASLELTQLTINYEAMLSTVGRVSQLSLVNYL